MRWHPLRQFRRTASGVAGLFVVLCVVVLAVVAPWLAPHDPYRQQLGLWNLPPLWMFGGRAEHLLSTDFLGRDVLSRLIYDARISLVVGVGSVAIALALGVSFGLAASYFGGWVDSLGAGHTKTLGQHILINLAGLIVLVSILEVGRNIILESVLSFLGLGVQPPTASWGNMVGEGRPYLFNAWWLATFPGLAIFVTTLSVTFVGDAMRRMASPGER